MNRLQSNWKKWRPRLVAAGAAGFVIALLAVTIAVIVGPGTDDDKTAAKPSQSSTTPADPGTEKPDTAADTSETEAPAPEFDADGLVPMEVTTDPRVAAASAAQVLMSVDTTKVQWVDDFREESLARVMRPSPDYVGPGAGFSVKQFGGDTITGDEYIARAPQLLADMDYSPSGWWWMLGDAASFGGYTSYGATILSRAVDVYDKAEMDAYAGDPYWTKPADGITVDIDPEASFGLYWVRVETTTTTGGDQSTVRNPVALAIYCDAPSDGGTCGVIGLMTRYPDAWKTDY
ncbi:hypothetical protein [Leucobacter musarum]|uniref:hypothetical protein n=1 Tax=Leucobacter musarum TaxID=1930747 RepID=UPI0006A7E4C8|nr:hypothetical protein [Leucobacter musarum]